MIFYFISRVNRPQSNFRKILLSFPLNSCTHKDLLPILLLTYTYHFLFVFLIFFLEDMN